MIANYGYEDGSGVYYISIDTDKCVECTLRACAFVCPSDVFKIDIDDYDDEVAMVKEECIKILKQSCTFCKSDNRPRDSAESLPCEKACDLNAIEHTW